MYRAATWLQIMINTWKQGTALIKGIAHRLGGAEEAGRNIDPNFTDISGHVRDPILSR